MLIEKLVLTNFRVYAGENQFDLKPRIRYGKSRPIVLFGGLNGAGKTSILSGVRLALYGRAALGQATSQKRYEDYLLESIHHSRGTQRTANSASVQLTFSYAKLGMESHFDVERSWEKRGKKVKEHLQILENGIQIKRLNYDQAQNFLNELIPIGVSDLFFFDGEKIAELADDTRGTALEHSIKKLLGLDIVERLSSDLTVLSRNLVRVSSKENIDHGINEQQNALEVCRSNIERIRQDISTKSAHHAEVALRAKQLESTLNDRGGRFYASRAELENKLDGLTESKLSLIAKISTLLADTVPFILAEKLCDRVKKQIEEDLGARSKLQERDVLSIVFRKLSKRLQKKLPPSSLSAVESEFLSLTKQYDKISDSTRIVHDLTPGQAGTILSTFTSAKRQGNEAKVFFQDLEEIESNIDELVAALARAPDDAVVKSDFENLQSIQRQLGKIESELERLRLEAKEIANTAVEIAKKLDKLYADAARTSDQRRILDYIGSSNGLLTDFVNETTAIKIADLERQFTECFSRLARKDDLSLQIRIDPKSYNVTLLSQDGRIIAKDELSAGEKQVFAISVLEALAKTSGRQLPMIVDTPLGRLDSKHRKKLVEGYFPRASHQMVILSTDTEVDESFYRALSPDISRAYRLDYDPNSGSTQAEEGYFWQVKKAS